jgi:hypothetical protein
MNENVIQLLRLLKKLETKGLVNKKHLDKSLMPRLMELVILEVTAELKSSEKGPSF